MATAVFYDYDQEALDREFNNRAKVTNLGHKALMSQNFTLKEAQIIIEEWRKHYNTKRPHSALGYRPPAPEAIVLMATKPVVH